ncbi:MAG: response regulator transcription factor [Actinomycetota bacterium]
MRLLIVEDEADLADALAAGLRAEGYAVDVAFDVTGASERLVVNTYDLVALDLGLPDGDGLELCQALRSGQIGPNSDTRVIVITARDALDERIRGLDTGADDYVVKPFDLGELAARIRALLRRDVGQGDPVLQVAELCLDAARHEVSRGTRPLDLTAKEFALLRYLMLHPGRVLTTEELLEHVWDENVDPFSNIVRVTISNLRRKLVVDDESQPIETVVGVGYKLIGA